MDFAEYVAARRPALVRCAILLGCPAHDAEDLVQTTLTKAFRHWRRVSKADQPDAYVHRMLVNCLRDARARRWQGELPTEHIREDTDGTVDLAEGLAVRRALAAMSKEHREVLVLRFYADLSERAVADVLGLPAGTVKSRTSRALKALAADENIVRST